MLSGTNKPTRRGVPSAAALATAMPDHACTTESVAALPTSGPLAPNPLIEQ